MVDGKARESAGAEAVCDCDCGGEADNAGNELVVVVEMGTLLRTDNVAAAGATAVACSEGADDEDESELVSGKGYSKGVEVVANGVPTIWLDGE